MAFSCFLDNLQSASPSRNPRLTGELRAQVDRVWDAFWTGGISNPFEVIEHIIYLLFIKCLDELHTLREAKANRLKQAVEDPIFSPGPAHLSNLDYTGEAQVTAYVQTGA